MSRYMLVALVLWLTIFTSCQVVEAVKLHERIQVMHDWEEAEDLGVR